MTSIIPELPTWNPLALATPARTLPFPFDKAAQWFYLARAGVHRAIRHFTKGNPSLVIMPAYHHGVEVEAVLRAGARVRFYRVDDAMRIDEDDLKRKARDARVVYVTHFAGFAQPLAELSAWCRQREIALFEDCALALFSRAPSGAWLGSLGDASVFCLYKTLPVPHGGILFGASDDGEALTPAPLWSTLRHLGALGLSHLELRVPELGGPLHASLRALAHGTVDRVAENVQTGTMSIGDGDLTRGASPILRALIARVDASAVIQRRRRNFTRLAEALAGWLPVIGHPLPEGTCPLFVPVRVADKQALHRALAARGVHAVNFWSSGHPACDPPPEVVRLRREILELPCHQSLEDEDIDRVARAVKQLALNA